MTKKKSVTIRRQLSPIDYIKTKARQLPIYNCYVNSSWVETGLTSLVVSRQHKNGNFTLGYYFIDTYWKGLFKSGTYFNFTKAQLDELVGFIIKGMEDKYMIVEIDYSLAHNIIYGGLEFAEKKGYSPGKGFELSRYILEENDGKIEYIELSFGKNEFREEGDDDIFIECIEKMIKQK